MPKGIYNHNSRVNRVGIRYNRLVVKRFVNRDWTGTAFWLCKCDYSKEIIISGNHLQTKHTKSCGYLRQETSKKNAKEMGNKNIGKNYLIILMENIVEKIRKKF